MLWEWGRGGGGLTYVHLITVCVRSVTVCLIFGWWESFHGINVRSPWLTFMALSDHIVQKIHRPYCIFMWKWVPWVSTMKSIFSLIVPRESNLASAPKYGACHSKFPLLGTIPRTRLMSYDSDKAARSMIVMATKVSPMSTSSWDKSSLDSKFIALTNLFRNLAFSIKFSFTLNEGLPIFILSHKIIKI